MTREQFLLCKLAEEAAELAKEAMKTQQFGMLSSHPKYTGTNANRISEELNDLLAVIDMMNEECEDFFWTPDEEAIERKVEKIEKYYELTV